MTFVAFNPTKMKNGQLIKKKKDTTIPCVSDNLISEFDTVVIHTLCILTSQSTKSTTKKQMC